VSTPTFDKLSKADRDSVVQQLYEYQTKLDKTHYCYICEEVLELSQPVDVDHIKAKDRGGLDNRNNWGLTHLSCNRSKSNRDLDLQRYLSRFQRAKRGHLLSGNDEDTFTVGVALINKGGSNRELRGRIEKSDVGETFQTMLSVDGKDVQYLFPTERDLNNPDVRSFTALIPIEYLYHDASVNPRAIVDLEGFIEEFYRGNPQLLPSLGYIRLEDGKGRIQLFDGQHKAAAQLFLGHRRLYVRVFIDPDLKLLQATNFRAHTSLVQLHFPMAIQDKVGHDLYLSAIDNWLADAPKDQHFRENTFFQSLGKEDRSEMRGHFQGYLKFRVVSASGGSSGETSKYFDYVEMVSSRSKAKPLAYETVRKAFFNNFLYLEPSNEPADVAAEMRDRERDNLVKLLALFSRKVLESQFRLDKGIFKIEERLATDAEIRDPHLRAYRICRQAPLIVVMRELREAISQLLSYRTRYKVAGWDKYQMLWADIAESDWRAISVMLDVILGHKVWIERNPAHVPVLQDTRQKSWEEILLRGTFPGATQAVYEPLDHSVLGRAVQDALRRV